MNNAYFMSFVLAAALPAMAAEEQYDPLFKGVKDGALVSNDGGTWTTGSATITATNDNTAVSFETADGSPITLGVTATPADTNTIAKVELQVTLADVGDFMNDLPQGAQVAFCVCTNSFNAWNGSTWVALNEVPAEVDDSQTTNLTVEISYQGARARKARFTVGDTVLVTRDGSLDWVDLCGTGVTSKNNLDGFGINGEGIIAKADASVMLGVAEYDGVKYGTIKEAVGEAIASRDTTATIDIVRDTTESIDDYPQAADMRVESKDPSVPVTVRTDEVAVAGDQTEGESGAYTATVRSGITAANVYVTLPSGMGNKEVKPGSVKVSGTTASFEVRTASSIVAAVVPADRALSANVEKLHEFLGKTTATKTVYEKANPTAGELATELAKTGDNGIPMYQSYALGIDQNTPVKPITVASDTNPSAITLSIPALETSTPSGDYTTIKYVMTKPNSEMVEFNKGANIEVPLSTGSYQVKIVME